MSVTALLLLATIGAFPPPQIGTLHMPVKMWIWVLEAAEATRISPYVIAGVMAIESRYHPTATSGRGKCVGLMQLNRDVAKGLGVDPWNPKENIMGGARILARLLKKHHGNLRLAVRAYNGTGYKPYEDEVLRATRQAERQIEGDNNYEKGHAE